MQSKFNVYMAFTKVVGYIRMSRAHPLCWSGLGIDRLSAPIFGILTHIGIGLFFLIRWPIRDQFKTGLFWPWCSRASLSAVTTMSPALSNPQHHLIGNTLWLHAEPRRTKESSNKVFWLLFLLKKWKLQWHKHQNWNSKNSIYNYGMYKQTKISKITITMWK